MLAKRTVKNQITLPKAVASQFPGVEYFEVKAENDRIILEPVKKSQVKDVWDKLEKLGITEDDVTVAVRWARKPERKRR
jgi:virulence-associated protein VagC